MSEQSYRNITQVIRLAKRMIHLADQGFSDCEDDGCLFLYSLVRDGAYRMKLAAEKEQKVHDGKERGNLVRGI